MLLPLSQCRRHQGVGGSLRSVLLVERENNVGDLLVRQELPDTVTRQQYDFIFRRQRRLGDIRLGRAANRMRDGVAETAAHGQAWRVDVLDPDALRATEAAAPVLSLRDLAAASEDSLLLFRRVWLVVNSHSLGEDILPVSHLR